MAPGIGELTLLGGRVSRLAGIRFLPNVDEEGLNSVPLSSDDDEVIEPIANTARFYSNGAHFLFADGSVLFVADDVDG